MATRHDPSREAFWRRTIRRCTKSGKTITEFCAKEGLTASAYHYWQKKIQRLDTETQNSHSSDGPSLVPIQLLDDHNSAAPVEIVAANGYVIRFSEAATTDHMQRVLRAISELN